MPDSSFIPSRAYSALIAFVMAIVGCQRGVEETVTPTSSARSVSNRTPHDHPESALESLQLAIRQGDAKRAKAEFHEAMIREPEDPAIFELAGDFFASCAESATAIKCYQTAKELQASHRTPSVDLLNKLGRAWMAESRPFEAVAVLREMVAIAPEASEVRTNLAGLLASLGLQREAAEHLRWLVQRGYGGSSELLILSDLTRCQTDEAMCKAVLERHPENHLVQFSLATLDAHFGRWADVSRRLQPIVEAEPDNTAAVALYGRGLVEVGDQQSIESWWHQLPAGIETERQYWLAVGIFSEKRGEIQAATRAYWQAAKRDEFDAEALGRLVSSLTELNIEPDFRTQLTQRIQNITRMRRAVDELAAHQLNSQKNAVAIAEQMEAMGRSWEAAAWLRSAAVMTSDRDPSLQAVYQSVRSNLTGKTPWQRLEALIVRQHDLSHLPRGDWPRREQRDGFATQRSLPGDEEIQSFIRFDDQARLRHLDHICKIKKTDGDEAGLWIYQSISSGVGVIDFDVDGWPDLYLTTMEGEPNQLDSGPNRLYRSRAGEYVDVTSTANVGDLGFAQGVGVGDCNADGFPDLYVANIGQNRLYRNNCDGTFSDITRQSGIHGTRWTTSVALVDIDQDGCLDLYDVGYCAGEEVFTTKCVRDGFERSCSPLSFSGQRDRVWQGQPDGTFLDVTSTWLGDHSAACGLAIVAGQFDECPGIDLYVANDMSANHFWSSTRSENPFRLQEQAAVRGVAVDARSLAQASMGISVADPDMDGDFDFFLTNHAGEANAFYEQVRAGVWVDHTERAGLSLPSTPMLGFGTEWFDADNDGTLELMVANGHVDDFTHLGDMYRMPTQIFRRHRDGVWKLLAADRLGDYFQQSHLARNLVNADINRDGRTDAIVTRLFDPVALLINQSDETMSWITFFLKGTDDHPDAIGSTVSIEVNHQVYRCQRIAGDGFQCSGQPCIHFGLGEAGHVDSVVVQWAGGTTEKFGGATARNEYLLIQGSGTPYRLDHPH